MKSIKLIVMAAIAAVALNSFAPGQDDDIVAEPSENFYLYANGEWLKNNQIPADKPKLGRFDVLADENQERIRTIIEEAAKANGEQGSASQKIGDLYALGMDTATRNRQGYESLKPLFSVIDAMDSIEALPRVIAQLNKAGVWPLLVFYVWNDPDNTNMNTPVFHQSGLGMPGRGCYLNKGEHLKSLRNGYKRMLAKYFGLIGEQNGAERAEAVFGFEKTIAKPMLDLSELNMNPSLSKNKREAAELNKLLPGFDWNMYFSALNVKPTTVNVSNLKYFEQLGGLVNSTDLNVVKDYLKMSVVRDYSGYLSADFINAGFEFGKMTDGIQEQRPLWKQVVDAVDGVLGEQIGQLYVKKYFPESYKMRIVELIENLRTSFSQRIDNVWWMSDETKAKAHEKLAAMTVKVGYPEVWRDYSKLNIDRNLTFAENIMAANRFELERVFADIDKPVDKSSWLVMTPQTVNAFYIPSNNEIMFPAAILQPPFFYGEGDDATNYGGIGVIIGHEMTHGFDNRGRHFDKDGNIKDWWTSYDVAHFGRMAGELIAHFDGLQAIDSVFCNGQMTLDENIADNGGLNMAYQALRNATAGKADPMTDGQTMDERFLLSYAHIWACNVRDEFVRSQVNRDSHAPFNLRVNGQMMLFDLFYKTFNIPDSSAMWVPEEKRIVVW